MHALLALTGTQWGTAQDLTFGILLGVFCALVIMLLFWMRTGHERAHRDQVLRRAFRHSHERGRLKELEEHEPPPQAKEMFPR